MKHFFTLLKHELRGILLSPSTYLASFFFLIVMGFIYQVVLEGYNKNPQEMLPSNIFLNAFFIPVFFLVPLLTMRSIAEERRMGLMDSLLTTPITSIELVASKFAAAYLLYSSLYLLTLAYPVITYHFFPDDRILDQASLIGGYSFICLSGLLFVSFGIFASSLTRSQLVAGIFCFSMLFGLILGGNSLNDFATVHLDKFSMLRLFVENIHVYEHVEDFSRGVLDTRPFVFYISGALLMLSMAVLAVDHKH
ncbi:MAG: ABC transporter permease [Verrucomicrobia bacterium]|nr:ABC transporter permease [Verrucomicrobiota bacterium]